MLYFRVKKLLKQDCTTIPLEIDFLGNHNEIKNDNWIKANNLVDLTSVLVLYLPDSQAANR